MKWFKHDSNANTDAKLRRLRLKYGMEGYGVYWYCLEMIASNVDTHNLTFELEHDAEIIAHDTGIHYERIQEMMTFMVNLGLFENQNNTITCLKMMNRTDDYIGRLVTNKLRSDSEQTPNKLQTNSEVTPKKVVVNRIEENRIDITPTKKFTPPSVEEVKAYCLERNNGINPNKFVDHYLARGWKVGKSPMKDWKAAVRTWEKDSPIPKVSSFAEGAI